MKLRCNLSNVPLRAESSDKSEMTSQILYGELVEVLTENENWLNVRCCWDSYEGWIAKEHEFSGIQSEDRIMVDQPGVLKTAGNKYTLISPGSLLSKDELKDFQIFRLHKNNSEHSSVIERAHSYLETPYLWGGRARWGIDCSGFMQIIFALSGIKLPRDASQQVERGQQVNLESAQAGDLAFFKNDKGNVTHVGLCLNKSRIIHASGKVRIDELTSEGIIRKTDGKCSHTLHSITRISNGAL